MYNGLETMSSSLLHQHLFNLIRQRFFTGLAEMHSDDVGGAADRAAEGGNLRTLGLGHQLELLLRLDGGLYGLFVCVHVRTSIKSPSERGYIDRQRKMTTTPVRTKFFLSLTVYLVISIYFLFLKKVCVIVVRIGKTFGAQQIPLVPTGNGPTLSCMQPTTKPPESSDSGGLTLLPGIGEIIHRIGGDDGKLFVVSIAVVVRDALPATLTAQITEVSRVLELTPAGDSIAHNAPDLLQLPVFRFIHQPDDLQIVQ